MAIVMLAIPRWGIARIGSLLPETLWAYVPFSLLLDAMVLIIKLLLLALYIQFYVTRGGTRVSGACASEEVRLEQPPC